MLDVPAVLADWFSLCWILGFDGRALLLLGLMLAALLLAWGCLSKPEFIDGWRAEEVVKVMGFVVVTYLGMLPCRSVF